MATKDIISKRTKNDLTITINQQTSVQYVNELFAKLKKIKYDRDHIIFILGDDNEPDLTFIQILVSLKRSKLSENQKITLKAPLEAVKKYVILDSINEIELATT
jgi:hypothetical protein